MRIFKPFQVLAAAGVMLGLVHVLIYEFTEPGDYLYRFIYERGPVQYAIPLVACLVAALLLERISQYRWNRAQFNALEQGQRQASGKLAERLKSVGKAYGKHGAAAAAVRAERAAEDYDKRIDNAYGFISSVTCSLPALGLFGSLLGMSKSLFISFGSGSQGTESVQMFVTALSTAMDTTVLAIACAVPLFGCIGMLSRLEHDLAERYVAFIRERFGLDEAAGGDGNVQALSVELRRMTAKIATETKATFEQILRDSTVVCREGLERAVAGVLSLQQRHDKNMVDKIAAEMAAGLGQSVDRVGDLLKRQNGRLAEDMIQHVGKLENALQNRTPEEILIRYQHNGHASKV